MKKIIRLLAAGMLFATAASSLASVVIDGTRVVYPDRKSVV